MSKKESAFVSAVICSSRDNNKLLAFVDKVGNELRKYFTNFEIIVIDNCNPDMEQVSAVLKKRIVENEEISIVHMSEKQDFEACMRAGVDAAIGDFVYEFEDLEYDFETDYIWKSYERAQEGFDIVSVVKLSNNGLRYCFYNLINKYSQTPVDIHATLFRLVSRRAINRVLGLDLSVDWRTAAYASCGLKSTSLEYSSKSDKKKNRDIFLAIDCFLLYTNLPKYIGLCLSLSSVLFLVVGIAFSFCNGLWAAVGFKVVLISELFILSVLFAMVLFQTTLYLKNSSARNRYLITGVEKIQKMK